MMKKWLTVALTLLLVAGVLAACGGGSEKNNGEAGGAEGDKKQRIALVLPEPIGVNPFYEMMDNGLKKAGEEFGVEVRTTESTDPSAFEQNLRATVAENYDLIITATFNAVDALNKVAVENPDLAFAIIDESVDQPNVRSVVFREHEASYLLGAMAGLVTESNKVGAVVAMQIPLLEKFTSGFEQGLKHTNPEADFQIRYVGSFVDSPKGKELALELHAQGADFIAGMAAVSDFGVFEAAEEKGFYTSGQDVDRTVDNPERIILSQLKGTDTAAYETVKSFVSGNFEFGVADYGLKEDGVGLTFVTRDSASPLSPVIGQDKVDQVKAIADDIISGKITVVNPLTQ